MATNNIYPIIRKTIRSIVLDILGVISRPKPGIHILNGHRIEDEAEPETFRNLLMELNKYVDFVNVEKAVEMVMSHQQPMRPVVAFTFDDGFMDNYDIFAPVLEEYGVNALFFVNPNYVDGDEAYIDNFNNNIVMTPNKRPMRWSHIRELSERGHIIGAHTMDHYMINTNNEAELRYQIETCKDIIEKKTGKECLYFAFPYGKLSHANRKSIDIACNCYKYVFSQSDYKRYFSFDDRVINRRHFEPFWPVNHVMYFLSCIKKYDND